MAKLKLSVTVDEAVVARVDRICERTGENRSECMERLVRLGADAVSEGIAMLDSTVLGRLLGMLGESPTFLGMVFPELTDEEREVKRRRFQSIRKGKGLKGAKGVVA